MLEFVLNVRDFDEETPIAVVGSSVNELDDQVLSSRKHTLLLGRADNSDELAGKIRNVLSAKAIQQG